MSEGFRTKLAHWLFSMLSLHLLVIVAIIYDAFWPHLWGSLPAPFGWRDPDHQVWRGVLGQLGTYPFLSAMLMMWHSADFLQRDRHAFRLPWRIGGYQWLGSAFWAFGLFYLLSMSSFLNGLTCPTFASASSTLSLAAAAVAPNNDVFMLDDCGLEVPGWKKAPMWVCLIALGLLTLVKVIALIGSWVRYSISVRSVAS